jgi:hypothetical protein
MLIWRWWLFHVVLVDADAKKDGVVCICPGCISSGSEI